ncbi:HlyD family secretion protein [Henriciella aquimarina]|uniref:HlyD family secretion protein n=1 Tax=Henriciella aquimarina TaxID=545261 RepID=UPI00117B57A6|nr:HlyD family efflux transporter periplasmic adaptor subunit [Henriciella aquimarina]
MTDTLFRPEALDYQAASSSQFGRPTGVLPSTWSVITMLMALFMIALGVFVVNVDFARKETVRGALRVDGAEAKIYPQKPGVIQEVYVTDGQIVAFGDPLFKITHEHFLGSGGSLSGETLAALRRERESLLHRETSIQASSQLSIQSATTAEQDARRRQDEILQEINLVQERLTIAEDRVLDIEELRGRGIVSEPVYNERVEAVSALRQTLLQRRSALADAASDQRNAETEIRQIRTRLATDLSDIAQRLSQIDNEEILAMSESGYTLLSYSSGKVTALAANVGEQAQSGLPLAIILPLKSSLVAEAYLPSRAIGFMESGQSVRLRYDAFPYQKFGTATGTVKQIADTAQLPQEIGINSKTGEAVYRVEIQLDKQSINAFSKEFQLQPGMEFSADIVLENRSLLDWLLNPLLSGS